MRHYWSLDGVYLINSWVTIGSFDGVHRGHQEILRLLTSSAREHDAKSVVLTFFPHPAVVLGKRIDPFYLTSPEEKAELLYRLVPSSLFTLNTEGIITSWNDRIAEITGYSAQEAIGSKCTLFADEPCNSGCGLFNPDIPKPIIRKQCTIKTKKGDIRIISKNADFLKDNEGVVD